MYNKNIDIFFEIYGWPKFYDRWPRIKISTFSVHDI